MNSENVGDGGANLCGPTGALGGRRCRASSGWGVLVETEVLAEVLREPLQGRDAFREDDEAIILLARLPFQVGLQ